MKPFFKQKPALLTTLALSCALALPVLLAPLGYAETSKKEAKISDEEAEKIMKKGGCVTCHAIKDAKIGPAYKAVAERYRKMEASTKAYLKDKKPKEHLIAAVRGGVMKDHKWKKENGQPYGAMPPAPAGRIPDEDLGKLIDYILGLK